jgi:hypothetical protein
MSMTMKSDCFEPILSNFHYTLQDYLDKRARYMFWAAARKSDQNVHTNCMGKASRGAA